jgi:cysteine rich repeat protein
MSVPWRFFWGPIALGFLGLLISGVVHAAEIPCSEEIRTLCADVQPGGGRILQCLKDNAPKLSPACAQRADELREMVAGPMGVCRDDWVRYCYHSRGSKDATMLQCLQANQANMSPDCQKAMQGMGGKQRQKPDRMMQ